MRKSALLGILTAGFLTFSLGNNVDAETKEVTDLEKVQQVTQADLFHEGEEPLEVSVDEKTGVIVKMYPAPQEQTGLVQPLGAGEWDLKGTEKWVFSGIESDIRVDGVYRSQGGNYMVRIPAHTLQKSYGSSSPYFKFELYEDDPVNDDYLGSKKVPYNDTTKKGVDLVFDNINGWLDGGVAELYTKHWTNYTTTSDVYVKYYD